MTQVSFPQPPEFASNGAMRQSRSARLADPVVVGHPDTAALPVANPARVAARTDVLRWVWWLPLAAFFVFEAAVILSAPTGPFIDESIYIISGLRTLQGFGLTDQYLTWFAGSLLWPLIAASAASVLDLPGARLAALVLVSGGLLGTIAATRNLFGARVAFLTALALGLSGPVLALGRMAVYDVPAILGIGLSFWAITELYRRDNRIWLLVASGAFSLAIVGKYGAALCVIPLALLIVALRGRRGVADMIMFGLLTFAFVQVFFLPLRDQIGQTVAFVAENTGSKTLEISKIHIQYSQVYFGLIPFTLALGGLLVAKGQRRVGLILLGSLLIWPAFHIVQGTSRSDYKHVVYGFLFGYPLIGLALAWLSRRWVGRIVAAAVVFGLAILGSAQLERMSHAWPDARPTIAYLEQRVTRGQRLLSSDSWTFAAPLYAEGRISSPWDVYDVFRVSQGDAGSNLCNFDWVVDEGGSFAWPREMLDSILACGSYEEVWSSTSMVTNLGSEFTFITYPVRTTVWRRVERPAPTVIRPPVLPAAVDEPVEQPVAIVTEDQS